MDSVRLPNGEYVPIADTVCECGHWHCEHVGACATCRANDDGTDCPGFLADPRASMPQQIIGRGGDPSGWPDHVMRHAQEWAGLELARVGISGDDETIAVLRGRLIRGEATADQLAEILSGRPASMLDTIESQPDLTPRPEAATVVGVKSRTEEVAS